MKKRCLMAVLMSIFYVPALGLTAEPMKTYTDPLFLYSVDYPETWHAKEINNVAVFAAPLDSTEDKFAENVNVVVEDLTRVPTEVTLIDYYRKSTGSASKMLTDFKVLEEARTQWIGRDAVVVLYTAKIRGEKFKFKAYTVMADKTVYVLTYTAREGDFDSFLPQAERLMRSIRLSP